MILWASLVLTTSSWAQHRARDLEPRLLVGGGVNLQSPNVVGGTYDSESAIPWVGGRLETGVSMVYRERVGVGVAGGWGLTGYVLWPIDSICYDLYHTASHLEARIWWIFPCDRGCAFAKRLGIAFGNSYQQADRLESTEDGLDVITRADKMVRPYIAPEVGLFGAEWKDRVEVSVRYLRNLDRTPAWTSTVSGGGGEATYSGTDDQLALILRYHIGLPRKPLPSLPLPEVARSGREADTLALFSTPQQRITLRLWDNAEYDGDTISVLLNEEPVLVAYELTHHPERLRLDLRDGWNTIRVVAHNEGRVPPNTATCIVRRGKGPEELLLRTSDRNDQVIVVRRE